MAKKKIQEVPKTMRERLKELKFFCPGDEASELFLMTCNLSKNMSNFGETEKAEILFEWAKEQAVSSRKWCEENEMNLDDFITGIDLY